MYGKKIKRLTNKRGSSHLYKYRIRLTLCSLVLALVLCLITAVLVLKPQQQASRLHEDLPIVFDEAEHKETKADACSPWLKTCDFQLKIEDTDVNCEVVQTNNPEYYLTHKKDGTPHFAGCPFVDLTFPKNSFALTVYGHAVWGTHLVFSDLKLSYQEDVFELFGNAILTTNNVLRLEKLGAFKIHERKIELVEPMLTSLDDLHTYLRRLPEQSQEHTLVVNYENLLSDIRCVLLLVTCSEVSPGQETRTLVVYGHKL